MSGRRFSFDDVVRIVGGSPDLAPVRGERGVVVGLGEDALPPVYGVWVYRDGEVWSVEEDALEPTGEVAPRERSTHALRVRVDAEGRGHAAGLRRL